MPAHINGWQSMASNPGGCPAINGWQSWSLSTETECQPTPMAGNQWLAILEFPSLHAGHHCELYSEHHYSSSLQFFSKRF